MRKPSPGVTVAEAAAILAELEGRPVSVAQVRSVLVLDTRGRALAPRVHGQTRVYTAVDLALVRLTFRLRGAGVSPTVARVMVANARDVLAGHWQHDDPMALAVVGLRGLVVYAASRRPDGAVAWVPLRDVWRGIEAAMRARRAVEPQMWQWKRHPAPLVASGGER